MKALVLLLLLVFTGCNATRLNADRQKTKLEVIFDFLWDYSGINMDAGDEIVKNFRKTGFGNAVITLMENAPYAADRYVDAVMDILPPSTRAIIETSTDASFKLVSHVIGEVVDNYLEPMVKNELEPLVESAAPVMKEALGQLFQGIQLVHDKVSPYITELMERVDPILQNIKARLHALKKSSNKTA